MNQTNTPNTPPLPSPVAPGEGPGVRANCRHVAGILLAAGASLRMGHPKQLLDWGGRPLVRAVAEQALASQLDQLYVVVGHEHTAVIQALVDLPLHILGNQDYTEGQSSSLRAGITALGPEVDAAMILLVDQPFVTAQLIDRLIDEWRKSNAPIVAPLYAGQHGPPVLFARSVFPDLLALQGDQGARRVVASDDARVCIVHFDDRRPLTDLDTPEDYTRLLK